MSTALRTTEIVMPGLIEPDGLLVQERDLPGPCGRPGCSSASTRRACRSRSSRCAAASTTTSRRSRSSRATTSSAPCRRSARASTRAMVGERVAAVVKTGAWATHLLVDADRLVPVPDGIDPADAETVVVNGITAWQMLHRIAKVRRGQTIVVLGANGGVGSTLVQLAVDAGITVIGTASDPPPRPACGASARHPSTTAPPTSPTGCAPWHPTVSTRCSTTSAVPASRTRGGCCAAAARSSPTAPQRPRTTPAGRSSRSSRSSHGVHALERPAQRPPRRLLQLLGRPPAPRALLPTPPRRPDPGARPPRRRHARRRRSPHSSRSPRPAAPWPSPSPTRSPGKVVLLP